MCIMFRPGILQGHNQAFGYGDQVPTWSFVGAQPSIQLWRPGSDLEFCRARSSLWLWRPSSHLEFCRGTTKPLAIVTKFQPGVLQRHDQAFGYGDKVPTWSFVKAFEQVIIQESMLPSFIHEKELIVVLLYCLLMYIRGRLIYQQNFLK